VKHPYSDYSVVGVAGNKKDQSGKDPSFSLFASVEHIVEQPSKPASEENDHVDDAKVDKMEEDVDNGNEETAEKPSMDLFKAIFLDSDSDSDEENDEDEKADEGKTDETSNSKSLYFGRELAPKVPPKPWEEKKQNLLRNTDPAKGIFANIDFDALNKKKVVSDADAVDKDVSEKQADTKDKAKPFERMILNSLGSKPKVSGDNKNENPAGRRNASDYFKKGSDVADDQSSSDSDEYGPALPPKPLVNEGGKSIVISSDSEGDQWKVKKKKKKDKKKKKKHKKEKKHSKRDSD